MEHNRDLIVALIVVLLLSVVYALINTLAASRPGSLIGHGMGIAGFVLMLATETLYSLRKRSLRMVRWGRMSAWFSAHIFMGIVGPYMVFLHTGFQFAGLAGVTMLLTAVVVGSGFVGRYIYTAVPRTALGVLVDAPQLEFAIRQADAQLQAWLDARPARLQALSAQMGAAPVVAGDGPLAVLGRALAEWDYKRHWRRAVRRLDQADRQQSAELGRLLGQRRALQRQIATLQSVRRLMALWHTIHVPLGAALFAAASMHVVGALYYS